MITNSEPQSRKNPLSPGILWLWRRLPVVIRAVISGLLLAASGTIPWAILVSANSKHITALPWAVVPTALYLWLWWRLASGVGRPGSSAEARRRLCRANSLSANVWGIAIVAGVLGVATVVLLQSVMTRLVNLPQQQDVDVTQFSHVTLVFWVLMGAVVAGVVEETAFRGYMQGPIERQHGPIIAILVTGGLFGFAHFTHPEVGLILLPYYLAVAAVYGALAYLTNSILPSLVLHAAGNIMGAFALFTRGASEWQASSSPPRLIWETGPDTAFLITLISFICLGIGAIAAYAALAKAARKSAGFPGSQTSS